MVAINGWLPIGLRPLGRLKACRDLPILVVHGAWNAKVPLHDARQNVTTLRAGGLQVAFQSYPSAHRLTNPMLSDVDTWLIGHCTAESRTCRLLRTDFRWRRPERATTSKSRSVRRYPGSTGALAKRQRARRAQGKSGMDGSFACPECGTTVEITRDCARPAGSLRLLPPAARGPLPSPRRCPWKRRRFSRPKWVVWSWAATGRCGCGHARRRCGPIRQEAVPFGRKSASIKLLVESSRQHEADGRLNQALIDLDAALELAQKAGPGILARLEPERKAPQRPGSARRPGRRPPSLRNRSRVVLTGGMAQPDRPRRARP